MAKSLIIVESPAKARTISKYLGRGYQVLASVGHVKDLPKSKLGIDVEHDFQPQYVVIRGKSKMCMIHTISVHTTTFVLLNASMNHSEMCCYMLFLHLPNCI